MTEATTQTRTTKTNAIRPDQLVDRYAELHAQVSEAQAEMMVIKAQLIATGQTRIKGTFITASITTAAPARRTDWKGVATELGATADVIAAHTATAEEGVTTLRLVAN